MTTRDHYSTGTGAPAGLGTAATATSRAGGGGVGGVGGAAAGVGGDPYARQSAGTAVVGHQRTSRRDQISRQDPSVGDNYGPAGRGGTATRRGGGSGAATVGPPGQVPGGLKSAGAAAGRNYAASPSGGVGQHPDDYGGYRGAASNVPQSISASAFTVGERGGAGYGANDPLVGGNMDRGMGDPRMDRGMDHHRSTSMPGGPAGMAGRSRSATRGLPSHRGPGYHSLDREGYNDRDFMMREPRERSLDRDFGMGPPGSYDPAGLGAGGYSRRDRSLDRGMFDHESGGLYPRDPMAGPGGGRMGTRLSPNPMGPLGGPRGAGVGGDPYMSELQHSNAELQRDLANLKKELEVTNQKLGSSMHSIKTFWSPELKKERALRKEESAKYSLINDQLKLLNSENQVSR